MDQIEKELYEQIKKEKPAFEVRKEDDIYYQGAFWLIANELEDIYKGDFSIICEKVLVDYTGKLLQPYDPTLWAHQQIWNKKYQDKYPDKDYKYFPRGRIVVKNGKAYFNCPVEVYLPQVVDSIEKEFCIEKLEHIAATKSSENGSHYDFRLK